MKSLPIRGLLLTVAMLSVLAVAVAPAHATVTPVGSTVSANSRDSRFSGSFGSTTCPTSEFTGTVSGDGTFLSGRLAFSRDSRAGGTTRCSDSLGGTFDDPVCRGSVTLRSTSSTRGTSLSGDVVLDRDFECSFRDPFLGDVTVRGPQTLRGCFTFNQGTQLLTVRCSLTATVGFLGTQTVTFSASYRVTTGRLTVS